MNYSTENEFANVAGKNAGMSEAEQTLRLIARLPAPEGLEDRVQAGVRGRRMEVARAGRVLEWPAMRPAGGWMRTAAAAAIVFVVAGGGWGVYSRVQTPQAAKVIVMPARVVSPGGFSNAGAMRTPTTLNGPMVKSSPANPVANSPANGTASETQVEGSQPKVPVPIVKKPVRRVRSISVAQPAPRQTPATAQK